MQFIYDAQAGEKTLTIQGENHRYLFKVRRFEVKKVLAFRNLQDSMLYTYKIESISKKEATLIMIQSYHDTTSTAKQLHLLWCIIDTKIIEKTLPMLNQLGVSKISFLYCDRSQKNFKPDLSRLEKILINSSQQCGRSDLMHLEVLKSLEETITKYPAFSVLDFGGETTMNDVSTIMIGCEGGFSQEEREKLQKMRKIGLNTPQILKSETAAVTLAAKLLI